MLNPEPQQQPTKCQELRGLLAEIKSKKKEFDERIKGGINRENVESLLAQKDVLVREIFEFKNRNYLFTPGEIKAFIDKIKQENGLDIRFKVFQSQKQIVFYEAREKAQQIKKILETKGNLVRNLHLISQRIGDSKISLIAAGLKSINNQVVKLCLCDNDLGDQGAKEIADCLRSINCKITTLDLSSNKISYTAEKIIEAAVKFVEDNYGREIRLYL